jgi:hypothetical protein
MPFNSLLLQDVSTKSSPEAQKKILSVRGCLLIAFFSWARNESSWFWSIWKGIWHQFERYHVCLEGHALY